ncbi:MAG: T9SS type A sorting domain-containing protein, partial [Flavobacteriales bacterium]|nr:T9SS type A sorting domain-containing protein [Flavobacteriales bacterium]
HFTIQSAPGNTIPAIQIFDSSGRTSCQFNPSISTVVQVNLAPGIYFLQTGNENTPVTRLVVGR